MNDETKQQLADQINAMGLSLESTFIPYSLSRNRPMRQHPDATKRKGWLSLNWEVRLMQAGRLVLATEYSQGSGHAPANKTYQKVDAHDRDAAIRWECENGKQARGHVVGRGGEPRPMFQGHAIKPALFDVLASLVLDASVLNYASFEDWAGDHGYDSDSREAERTYKTCLQSALALRNAIGQANLDKLTELFADY